jgi:hypothetical protein
MAEPKAILSIEETEGATRWSATLYGRAIPRNENPAKFGVQVEGESTTFHGTAEGNWEPARVTYPDLTFEGEWKANHLLVGDARVELSPDKGDLTPQRLADWFEDFAARSKVVDVTLTTGVVRVCRWRSFIYENSRGPDRKWTMSFEVLGRRRLRASSPIDPLTAKSSLASMTDAARRLDAALLDYPPGLAPGFLDRIRDAFGRVRENGAKLRRSLAQVADLARAPATALREMAGLARDVRDTMRAAVDVWDGTAYENQTAVANARSIASARAWKARVYDAGDTQADSVDALLAFLDTLLRTAKRYAAVRPGESLLRVSQREFGTADLWRSIADANGIVGQIVPAGVVRLVLPEA